MNSDGEHNRPVNGRSCMGRFVQDKPVTVTNIESLWKLKIGINSMFI
jgi:hypothetical protein